MKSQFKEGIKGTKGTKHRLVEKEKPIQNVTKNSRQIKKIFGIFLMWTFETSTTNNECALKIN